MNCGVESQIRYVHFNAVLMSSMKSANSTAKSFRSSKFLAFVSLMQSSSRCVSLSARSLTQFVQDVLEDFCSTCLFPGVIRGDSSASPARIDGPHLPRQLYRGAVKPVQYWRTSRSLLHGRCMCICECLSGVPLPLIGVLRRLYSVQ